LRKTARKSTPRRN